MSRALWNALTVVGVVGASVIVFMNRCEWLKWCDPLPDSLADIQTLIQNTFRGSAGNSQTDKQRLADAIEGNKLTPAQYNSLPTIGNTRDSNYRSTSINTNPNARKNAVTAINQQQKATPAGVKQFAAGSDARLTSYCKSNPNAVMCKNRSGLALSLHGYKMSVH